MILCAIAAMSKNRVIGKNQNLPWHIPEDLKYFKQVTSGKTIIMGRKTFESVGRPLPNRRNIVLTRQSDFQAEGVETFSDLSAALAQLKMELPSNEEVFIVGGAQIYREALPYTRRLYLTLIDKEFDGDTFFPELDLEEEFKLISRKDSSLDELKFSFVVADRVS